METIKDHSNTYTCPMHPEVVSDAPGNCPKCGMKLVSKGSQKSGGMMRMLLWCIIPIAIVLLLPFFGVRFDATWIIFIVLASCCVLPMLFMRHSANKSDRHLSEKN